MKCVCNDMALESGVQLLFHAWFSRAYMVDNKVRGAIFESKSGRQAVLADIVIDCLLDWYSESTMWIVKRPSSF